jgi:hypothetical protein
MADTTECGERHLWGPGRDRELAAVRLRWRPRASALVVPDGWVHVASVVWPRRQEGAEVTGRPSGAAMR